MTKKSPGMSQLGHSPFGREKLEGPKRHHDDHGKSDSVPGKGSGMAIPGGHWEKHYKMSDVRDTKEVAGCEWNPKVANTRTCTHTKVNREDH
jgi:hypothetical protein